MGQWLMVELASPEMMLALKTLARRPQDLDDIYQLMRLTGIRSPVELGRNLARFTGRRIFDMQGTPGMVIHIDPMFREIHDNAPPDLRPPESGEPSWLRRRWLAIRSHAGKRGARSSMDDA